MKENNLNKEDYELLQSLISITKLISEEYNSLYLLEIQGRKSSDEYFNLMQALMANINLENSIYLKLSKNLESIYAITNYIFPYNMPYFEDEIEILKSNEEAELIKIRINIRLSDLIYISSYKDDDNYNEDNDEEYYNEDNDEEYDMDEIDEDVVSENYIKDEESEKSVKEQDELEISIEKDIINTILSILNKMINNPKYNNLKNRLIKLKYNISFIYPYVEEQLFQNYFEINTILYLESKLTLDIQRKNNNILIDTFENYINEIMVNQLDSIIYLLFEDYDDDDKKFYALITQIYLRACFVFSKDNDIFAFRQSVREELEQVEEKCELVENILKEASQEKAKDREMPRIISLSRK